jgi:hypothetical protein
MSRTVDQIVGAAEITRPDRMSRADRLERWAVALERCKEGRLRTLYETEFMAPDVRRAMREDRSPLSVAFADPVLRSAGLKDDTFGEAARFFELSDWELHSVLCYCHFGDEVAAGDCAARVRAVRQRDRMLAGDVWGATMRRRALMGGLAAACVTGALLVL